MDWDKEIKELEMFYSTAVLPTEPIQLDACMKIWNCKLFVETHLATVRANNGKQTYYPYLERLSKVKSIIEKR